MDQILNSLPRRPSLQMHAVLMIFDANSELSRMTSPHIDRNTESIRWDKIFSQPLSPGHKGAALVAYALWTDEIRRGSAVFELALNMDAELKLACIQGLALRWGVLVH